METEYEVRVLDIDVNKLIVKLEELGATRIGEYFQRRYVYDFNPKIDGKWIRLRTNGEYTTLAIKSRPNETKIGELFELEEKVEDFEKTHMILTELGYTPTAYQENKRLIYRLDDVEFDIDSWPMIPTYVEIEGKNEEVVNKYINLLELNNNKLSYESLITIYKKYYNMDLKAYKELKFEEE